MKKLFGPMLVLATAALIIGCSADTQLIHPSAEPGLLTGVTWRMTAWYHLGVHHTVQPTDVQQTLFFSTAGRVVRDQIGGCCLSRGTWSANGDTTVLRLSFGDGTLVYQVDSLADRYLRLSWQAREGPVLESYRWGP